MDVTNILDAPSKQVSRDLGKATMKAAVLTAPRQFEIQNVLIPKPQPNEVVFKVEGCGVCASSIPVYEGRDWFQYPTTAGAPGHEAWGYITEIGADVKTLKVGDRIAALSYHGFAEYDKALASEVVWIPENIKNFPGEPLGCAMNILKRADVKKGQTVAIVGAGFLGALLIQLALNAGATVIALSQREYSLSLAEHLDAHYVIPMDDHYKVIAKVKEITQGRFCERVIEVTGKEWPLNLAGELTGERGKLIIAGYHQDGMRNVNIQLWNWRGFDVINAHERDPKVYMEGIEDAITAVMTRVITPEKLYTSYTLDQIGQAFEDAINRPKGFTKAIIKVI